VGPRPDFPCPVWSFHPQISSQHRQRGGYLRRYPTRAAPICPPGFAITTSAQNAPLRLLPCVSLHVTPTLPLRAEPPDGCDWFPTTRWERSYSAFAFRGQLCCAGEKTMDASDLLKPPRAAHYPDDRIGALPAEFRSRISLRSGRCPVEPCASCETNRRCQPGVEVMTKTSLRTKQRRPVPKDWGRIGCFSSDSGSRVGRLARLDSWMVGFGVPSRTLSAPEWLSPPGLVLGEKTHEAVPLLSAMAGRFRPLARGSS